MSGWPLNGVWAFFSCGLSIQETPMLDNNITQRRHKYIPGSLNQMILTHYKDQGNPGKELVVVSADAVLGGHCGK